MAWKRTFLWAKTMELKSDDMERILRYLENINFCAACIFILGRSNYAYTIRYSKHYYGAKCCFGEKKDSANRCCIDY